MSVIIVIELWEDFNNLRIAEAYFIKVKNAQINGKFISVNFAQLLKFGQKLWILFREQSASLHNFKKII